MIDQTMLLGVECKPATVSWTYRDAILYALSVGTTDLEPAHLARVYEKDLVVLPTFAALAGMFDVDELCSLPGTGFHFSQLLHGQQEVELHQQIPASGTIERTASIVGVHDKGKAAVVVADSVTSLDGAPLATSRSTIFVQGAGGFAEQGADSGIAPAKLPPAPERAPDAVKQTATTVTQAALYRLSGDWNTLHIDPAIAATVGLPQPILHGMCSFGIAVTDTIDMLLDGDARAVRRYHTRFVGMALPTDVLETRAWRVEGGAVFETVAANRDNTPILAGGGVFITNSTEI